LRCARDTLPALRREDSSILKGFVHSGKRTGPGTDREIGTSDHRAIGKNKIRSLAPLGISPAGSNARKTAQPYRG